MKKLAFFSSLGNQLNTHTSLGSALRRVYEIHCQVVTRESITTLSSCLIEAENNLKGKHVSVSLARDYLEDAVQIADILLENRDLNSDEKKLLSKAYGQYADFLRQTTSSTLYDAVRKYIDKSLKLDPENQLAKETDGELNYNFKT